MKTKTMIVLGALVLLLTTTNVFAQNTQVQSILDKVTQAYGGEDLTKAKAIQITDHNKGPWPGESEHPGVPELWRINEVLTIDFVNQRKSLLSWRVNRTSVDLDKFVYDGKQGIHFDLLHNKYSNRDWIKYETLGGPLIRTSDTMLAYMLNHSLQSAEDQGLTSYRGKPHHKLAFTAKNGNEFVLFADVQTGLINKMVRQHPSVGALTYVFSNHKQTQGVTYSDDMNFFVDGEIRLVSVKRGIKINPDISNEFAPLANFTHWGETIDTSNRVVKELAKGVYQVGKGRALNLFIDNGEGFVASGNPRALQQNYEALKQNTNTDKPVSDFVVTHHHISTIRGLDAVVGEQIKLILPESHLATVERLLKTKLTDQQVKLIADKQRVTLGAIEIIDLATAHSEHNLVLYLAKDQLLYAEGHYESDLKSAYPRVFKDMVWFYQQIQNLPLDVATYVDANSFRTFSANEYSRFAKEFKPHTCPAGFDICKQGY